MPPYAQNESFQKNLMSNTMASNEHFSSLTFTDGEREREITFMLVCLGEGNNVS